MKKLVKLSEVRKLDWDLLMEAILDTKDQQEEVQVLRNSDQMMLFCSMLYLGVETSSL